MRRHWQHTSFCMGQCVSSCGSKRTLDSVPTTPDTENYPGLIPSAKILHCKNSTNFSETEDQQDLTSPQKSKSSAAKFVTVFHQRRIVTHRINPEVDSQSHIHTCSVGTIHNQSAGGTAFHHGDMRDSTVKSYFRETISSAKKTSSKSVTFSEVSPPRTGSRKKFFSFGKSHSRKTTEETRAQVESSSASSPATLSKVFLRKKSKRSEQGTLPTFVKPHKEKQVCRVTLSPKHGTTVTNVAVHQSSPVQGSSSLKLDPNGDEGANTLSPVRATTSGSNQAMGNASSSSQGLVVEAVKTIKPIVKSNSIKNKNFNVDVNENDTKNTCAVLRKSVEASPGLTRKDSKRRPPASKNDSTNVTKDINKIKEENRLLRLKFFLEDSQENSLSSLGSNCDLASRSTPKMSRQNNFLANRSAIPLPKSTVGKSVNNVSAIPKLYSVPSNENEQTLKTSIRCPSSRLTSSLKVETAVQPTNLNSGNWVPAADFFDPASSEAHHTDSSPSRSTSRNPRRSSEPTRWTPPVSIASQKGIRDAKGPDIIPERRGTIGMYQQRKLQLCQNSANVPKAKPVAITTDKNGGLARNVPIRVVGIKKPEETKPFYTIGLYQNRPKPTETAKTFSGFHGVSTGMVRQRTQQFQSKVAEPPNAKVQSNLKDAVHEKNIAPGSTSPAKPGVLRSATYTIRRHGLVEERGGGQQNSNNKSVLKSKSDVDPRYLTWTVRKPGTVGTGKGNPTVSTHFGVGRDQEPKEFAATEERTTSAMLHPLGYPLQHNPSGASTSSMGTNEDGIGDHVVISDSEYLIDDEISDQPDLTLTFKDSSHKLSSSSSGESLLSDIMLDHLDLNQERLLGELTSDSAISDISGHKPVSKNIICDHSKVQETSKTSLLEKSCTKTPEKTISSNQTSSPASARTVRNLKSPRRVARPTTTTPKPSVHAVSNAETLNTSRSTSNLTKSSSTSNASSKYRITPDKKQALSKSTYGKTNLQLSSTSISPSLRSRASPKEQIENSKLTVENVNKLHKQLENANCPHTCDFHQTESLPVPFAEELLVEFHDLRDKLEKLQVQLETQERREREKDELILRLTNEVECLKSGENGESLPKDKGKSFLSSRWDDEETESRSTEKERYIRTLNTYENAAVQTENNNIFNRAVSYPEEDEKYGELVSFRIGRSSSLKKKL